MTTANLPKLNVPGPPVNPILGRLPMILRFSKDSIGYTRPLFETYGSVVSMTAGGGTHIYSPLAECPGTVFTCGADNVRTVTSQHEIYYKYPLSGRMYKQRNDSPRTEPLKHFGVGLFGVNSATHRQHRQLLMPAFHKQRIDSYRDDMVAITRSQLDQLTINEPVDIAQVMRLLTLRVATKTLFGSDIGEEGACIGQILQEALGMNGKLAIALLPFDIPGLPYHKLLNLFAQLDEEMRQLIHRKQVSNNDEDVISMLIQAQDAETGLKLSEDELLGHAGVIFAAGHETSANALTWTLFLLSQHPQIAQDVVDELQSVLNGEAPTVEQLSKLPLLERVIKESMRVLTPVPWNGRVTSQATELGGYELPKGTEVFVSIYQTHHLAEIYSEPEKFNPRRWETFEPTMFEYNPFSAGSRVCIGAGFAMMEIKIVLSMLLQKYRLEYIQNQRIDRFGLIVMSPKNGIKMIVRKDRNFTQGVGGVKGNVREMVELVG
ncbi:cytochrome P450 [Rivularia sp. UHCC 0363]|uniref:cytochrome P450 n=1 Tax=Rivularia sp. UHCC 0363 TaxID=3110244 RepID=UPI002B1EEE98|nr:cytochrome P450 [Rivularia sp. UHCC 0363]MEA5596136.1 cytochrome P450 [Rivularia sp. UHCC 0363]